MKNILTDDEKSIIEKALDVYMAEGDAYLKEAAKKDKAIELLALRMRDKIRVLQTKIWKL